MFEQLFPVPARPGTATDAVRVIEPSRHGDSWVFDDPAVGLVREPFVAGVTEMLDRLSAGIPGAAGGFRLLFAAHPFKGHQATLAWARADPVEGNWYRAEDTGEEGWLCPALSFYFPAPPPTIYLQAEPKPAGTGD
jgi:hypothetical protein